MLRGPILKYYTVSGGILIIIYKFILEFDKPEKKAFNKYGHLTKEQSKVVSDVVRSFKNYQTKLW